MKKFFAEFKKFITRGNVLDMAVGVIVGSSFTAIVNGLSNNILKPLINWLLVLIFGKDSLSEVYTMLQAAYDETGALDLKESIYIDWGAFINAVINFLLIAFVLFCLVKILNRFRDNHIEYTNNLISDGKQRKADRKAMKAQGIKRSDKAAVKAFYEAKEKAAAEAKAAATAEAEEAARLEKVNNPSTEDLLKEIRDLLKSKS